MSSISGTTIALNQCGPNEPGLQGRASDTTAATSIIDRSLPTTPTTRRSRSRPRASLARHGERLDGGLEDADSHDSLESALAVRFVSPTTGTL